MARAASIPQPEENCLFPSLGLWAGLYTKQTRCLLKVQYHTRTCGMFRFDTNAFLMGECIFILVCISIHSIEVSSLLQIHVLI